MSGLRDGPWGLTVGAGQSLDITLEPGAKLRFAGARDALAAHIMAVLDEHGGSYGLPKRPADLAYWVADSLLTAVPTADDLTAAWQEAEAALPEGWGLVLSCRDGMNDAYAINPVMSSAWAHSATGPTPAAALRALTARLREPQP